MSLSLTSQRSENVQLIASFFERTQGRWRSERRYYTLPDGEVKEIVSSIAVRFLPKGAPELLDLVQRHQLDPAMQMICGSWVSWDSQDSVSGKKQSRGETVFGVIGTTLYRDRGFATPKPVTAKFYFNNPDTLCLRTEYNDSVFEEEIKLIGDRYRTRQTIISRAGEQQMIGQYLETRLSDR